MSHYGHTTLPSGLRYDYQRQHILHPRLVHVGVNKDGTPHMIPTDSRFKDNEFLPQNRYKSPNGKIAGAIALTTPTKSTSNAGHFLPFMHHIDDSHIAHALANHGELEIDRPHDQEAAHGNPYVGPSGFSRGGDAEEAHMGLPEQSFEGQKHNAHRSDGPVEKIDHGHCSHRATGGIVDRALALAAMANNKRK
jgi:hypothetical protein